MIENLKKLENLINSELTSKIQSSFIANDELSIEINENDLIEIIQSDFTKSKFVDLGHFDADINNFVKNLSCNEEFNDLRKNFII